MHEHVQQHAHSRLAASGRVLDQPSDHDPVHRELQLLFSTIHIAHVESVHARVEQRHGERGQVGRSNGSGCNLVELEQKGGGGGSGGFGNHGI